MTKYKYELGRGFEPFEWPCWGNFNTPLHRILASPKFFVARFLLDAGASADVRNAYGRTALYEVVRCHDYSVVAFLIEQGANLNAVTEARSFKCEDCDRSQIAGVLPLNEAVSNRDQRLVRMLLEAGADVSISSPLEG